MRNEKYFFPFGGLLVMWRANGLRWTIDYPETRLYISAFYLYLNNERTLLFIGENQTRLLSPCCNVRDNRKSPPPWKNELGSITTAAYIVVAYSIYYYTTPLEDSIVLLYIVELVYFKEYTACAHTHTPV